MAVSMMWAAEQYSERITYVVCVPAESMPVAIPTQAVAPMTMATITPDGLVVASGDQRLVTGSVSDIEDDYPGM